MTLNNPATRFAFVVAASFTLVCLLTPGSTILAGKVWVASWLPMAAALDAANVTEHADKFVHAGLFAIVGGLGIRGWSQVDQRWRMCAFLLAFGLVTEGLQLIVPGRSASIGDWLADAIGVLIGLFIGASFGKQYLEMPVASVSNGR